MRCWADRSGAHSSRSIPARIAAMISTAWAAPWASACMSRASLIVNPSKPSRSRSVPPIIVRDNVAGSVEAERAWEALGFAVVEQVRLRPLVPAR